MQIVRGVMSSENAVGLDAVVDSKFERFKQWMIDSGFQPAEHFKLATFQDTGIRGLMTTKRVEENELLVSIPEKVLITTKTVVCSRIGSCMKRLSPLRALCAFLMVERCFGANSKWSPYIAMLPDSYTTPSFWPTYAVQALPNAMKESMRQQKADLKSEFEKLRPFLKLIQEQFHLPECLLDFALFRWAWFSVSTRCIYMRQESPLEGVNSESDCCALAPFLDFLNHSCQAKVRAGFNAKTKTYDIVTLAPIAKFDQVYINYGFHDNAKLALEYGFVLRGNPHSVVTFTVGELEKAVEDALVLSARLPLEEQLRDLCCTYDGPSWGLTSAIELLVGHSVANRKDGSVNTLSDILRELFETRLRHAQLRKEELKSKRLPAACAATVLDLCDEEIDILTAGIAYAKNSRDKLREKKLLENFTVLNYRSKISQHSYSFSISQKLKYVSLILREYISPHLLNLYFEEW